MQTPPLINDTTDAATHWPRQIFDVLRGYDVSQVCYVPDGGHADLIRLSHGCDDMVTVSLTTEEEGIAMALGASIGGARSVILMQSSGVGNCINMLSLVQSCRMPILLLITMRGEWGEFNPWQVPMGSQVQAALEMMGLQVMRADTAPDVAPMVKVAARQVFEGGGAVAVLLSQRLIGAKDFNKEAAK